MELSRSMLDASLVSLTGNEESVGLYSELEDNTDCTWAVHIMARYNQATPTKIVGTGVAIRDLTSKFNPAAQDFLSHEVPDYGSLARDKYSPLQAEALTPEDYHYRELDESGKYYLITYSMHPSITCYTAVGTKVPCSLSNKDWFIFSVVCGNPANFICVLVGNPAHAYGLLGKSLAVIRSVLLDHYGIIPSSNSLPLSVELPMVAVEFNEAPTYNTLVDLLYSRSSENCYSEWLSNYMSTTYGALYAIAYADDSRVVGVENFGSTTDQYLWSEAREWALTSGTGIPIAPPYRYPLLVALLANTARINPKSNQTEPVSLKTVITERSKFTNLAKLKELIREGKSPYLRPTANIETNVRATLVQLYSHTCKNCISFPPASEYPKRTEASKSYWHCYKAYQEKASLTGYLQLGENLIEASLANHKITRHLLSLCPDINLAEVITDASILDSPQLTVCEDLRHLITKDPLEVFSKLSTVSEPLRGWRITDPTGYSTTLDELVILTRLRVVSCLNYILQTSPHTLVKDEDLRELVTELTRKLLRMREGGDFEFIGVAVNGLRVSYAMTDDIDVQYYDTKLGILLDLLSYDDTNRESLQNLISIVGSLLAVPPDLTQSDRITYSKALNKVHASCLARNYILSLLD